MCVGIILKNGKHLQSIKDIEDHFKCNLEPYKWVMTDPPILRNCCTCQIDLSRFMNEEPRKSQFEYDYVEYWEKPYEGPEEHSPEAVFGEDEIDNLENLGYSFEVGV